MGDLRRIETVGGDGSRCWLCGQTDDMVLFDAPAHGAGGPRRDDVAGYSDLERVTLCYECEAMRRWHALDNGTDEEITPAAVCYIKPVIGHAERARLTRLTKLMIADGRLPAMPTIDPESSPTPSERQQ